MEKTTKIKSMQDVYTLLNSQAEDTYEEITQRYEGLVEGLVDEDLKELNRAYKLVSVVYGEVEHSGFNKWYGELILELSKKGEPFVLYEGEVERISIIDYISPEIFLNGFLSGSSAAEYAEYFFNDEKTKDLLEEANMGKTMIESSLGRINEFVHE